MSHRPVARPVLTGTRPFVVLAACLALLACGKHAAEDGQAVDELVREYLLLELSMTPHDPNHVDAWYGPAELKAAAEDAALSLAQIDERAAALRGRLDALLARDDAMESARIENLVARLDALRMRVAMNRGQGVPFDEESRRLFGATAPDHDTEHFQAILADIDALLTGDGSLAARVSDFRERFIIPPDRLEPVIEAAIAECRRRTLEHIDLPEDEAFRLEFVQDKPWSGYNWYQGDYRSLIQINTDLPIFISRAVDLGCHEGYPGHHTFNVLREQRLVEARGWLEYTLYPLFSPESLIAEGSGNYGVDLAFPDDERTRYERRELFPLAGIDPAQADLYYEVEELLERLGYAANEAARDWLDGRIDRNRAIRWLVDYTLTTTERAAQRADFIDTYRSYVINYNLGEDLVRQHVERSATTRDEQWRVFTTLISSPVLPGQLR